MGETGSNYTGRTQISHEVLDGRNDQNPSSSKFRLFIEVPDGRRPEPICLDVDLPRVT
jgi:hypothetical protein